MPITLDPKEVDYFLQVCNALGGMEESDGQKKYVKGDECLGTLFI